MTEVTIWCLAPPQHCGPVKAKGGQTCTSVSAAGLEPSRTQQEISKETPGFLTPTLKKYDSPSKAETGEERSART